jgi:hypothetical protein
MDQKPEQIVSAESRAPATGENGLVRAFRDGAAAVMPVFGAGYQAAAAGLDFVADHLGG